MIRDSRVGTGVRVEWNIGFRHCLGGVTDEVFACIIAWEYNL